MKFGFAVGDGSGLHGLGNDSAISWEAVAHLVHGLVRFQIAFAIAEIPPDALIYDDGSQAGAALDELQEDGDDAFLFPRLQVL